jgi:predicted unusual protein kinase regulating ubiquinone biosynthesis (AarF/ABC1/UbiB family)
VDCVVFAMDEDFLGIAGLKRIARARTHTHTNTHTHTHKHTHTHTHTHTGAMSRLGFIMPGTDLKPIARALEKMWLDAVGRDMRDFNLRTVTREFSKLVYAYPIRVPERFALVIRTLLTQVRVQG